MEMTEVILGGIIVSMFTGLIGYIIGNRGTIDDDECGRRQRACSGIICSELSHIKEAQSHMRDSQKIMKEDIKKILIYVKGGDNEKIV